MTRPVIPNSYRSGSACSSDSSAVGNRRAGRWLSGEPVDHQQFESGDVDPVDQAVLRGLVGDGPRCVSWSGAERQP
jgi:hypothetical protein